MFSVQWLVICTGFVTKHVYVLIVTPFKTKLLFFFHSLYFVITIPSFSSYVEHMCFLELCLRLILLPLSNFSQPAAVPILLFFCRLFLVYPASLYPKGSSTMMSFCCTLYFVLCMANLMPFSFLYLLFNRSFFCSLPSFPFWSFIQFEVSNML